MNSYPEFANQDLLHNVAGVGDWGINKSFRIYFTKVEKNVGNSKC
jgi:hypothetical protein